MSFGYSKEFRALTLADYEPQQVEQAPAAELIDVKYREFLAFRIKLLYTLVFASFAALIVVCWWTGHLIVAGIVAVMAAVLIINGIWRGW